MQVNLDHDRVVGEDREFTEDSVKTGGPFKQSKSGNATAADLKNMSKSQLAMCKPTGQANFATQSYS